MAVSITSAPEGESAAVLSGPERLAAVRDAVASVRLEGLEPTPALVAQLEQVASGERTLEEILTDIRDRIARGEV